MPKSRRARPFHLTSVGKKTGREQRDKLFENVRECVPQYQHCFVFFRRQHAQQPLEGCPARTQRQPVRARVLLGIAIPSIHLLFRYRCLTLPPLCVGCSLVRPSSCPRRWAKHPKKHRLPISSAFLRTSPGNVGLLFTDRDPAAMLEYLDSFTPVDFARAGMVATRDFVVPPGIVYSTGGEVDPADDIAMGHTVEPELRRLGMPTSMVRGKVFLGSSNGPVEEESKEGYVICRLGDVLDSRQTRLLKLFDICLAQFKIKVLA